MRYHITYKLICTALWILLLTGCQKFLDEIPDKTLTTPKNLDELQGLLDNENNNLGYPIGAELAADNISFTLDDWNYMYFEDDRNIYIWDPATDLIRDWQPPYRTIFRANVVLKEINNFPVAQSLQAKYDQVKGSAYFLRAFNFFELAQIFSPPYSSANAPLPYGIALKTTPDIDDKTDRSTIQETYDRIINDLKESATLLGQDRTYPSRPSRMAAFALLSRTYLAMADYVNAGKYADSALQLYDRLMDYNDPSKVALSAQLSFKRFNEEVLFHATTRNITELLRSKVDMKLINQYDDNDLRKQAFFTESPDGTFQFKGSYDGTLCITFFCGLTTDEMYFNRAECKARSGATGEAINDLNTVLNKRWRTGTFVPLTAATSEEAITLILKERRKELCFRPSLRWTDLRRLNLESKYATAVTKELGGQLYSLQPNDKLYTFLIPGDVIARSGIQQNPR